jgi:hypothetical protein
MNPKITHERLLQVLDYNPATGAFTWKVRPSNRIHVGDIAGVVTGLGYRFITIDREKMQASRLAWFYVHGVWPSGDVTFEDKNTDNCAIENLRDRSRIEAARLRKALSNNTTGFRGVSPAPKGGFKAAVTANYKQIMLGVFPTAEAASAVYEHAMVFLADAKTPAECEVAAEKIIQHRRKRVAWERLLRGGRPTTWTDFETFAADVGDLSEDEATVTAVDESAPVGKDNFRFLLKVQGKYDRSTKDGQAAYARAYREANPGRWRHSHLKNNYKTDDIEFERLKAAQGGKCLICECVPDVKLAVDHDHDTGAIRGLLCKQCNFALGQFGDDLTKLRGAVAYMERFSTHEGPSHTRQYDWLVAEPPSIYGVN